MTTSFIVRLRALLFRGAADTELDEELRYHLDRETERNVANGMSPRDARAAAQRAFGNVTVVTEDARDASRWRVVEQTRQDISYALRTFRRAPLFVATVILTIGLGIGLLSSAFTFFDAYVLRPLAVRDAQTLFDLRWSSANGHAHRFTWEQYQRLSETHAPFIETFAYITDQSRVRGHPVIGQYVSGNYFQMLGVPPAFGRTLLPSDANGVMVLSHRTWRTMFGGDSGVIGTRVAVHGTPHTVVGVAREGFDGLTSTPFDFWIPIAMTPRDAESVNIIARLAPAVTEERAHATFARWMREQTTDRAALERASDVSMMPRGTSVPRNPETVAMFAPVIIAFLLVMLIACANVANIMLARGMARQREIGIRLALGAGRARLIRQLLTEAVLLAIPAGALGYIVSRAAIWLCLDVLFSTVPVAYAGYIRVVPLDADARVMAFMVIAAIGAALAFGLAPALQATRPNIVQASRGDFDTQFRPSRLRNALVVAQITLSVVLLVCAGVLLSGARHTERLDPGIRTSNVIQFELARPTRERALAVLQSDPLVRTIAGSAHGALDGLFNDVSIVANGRPSERTSYQVVSPGYFPVLDLTILRGRTFTADEARSRAAVAIVSEATADHFWPGADPIGRTLSIPAADHDYDNLAAYHATRVVGVTRNAMPGWIGKNPRSPTIYFPRPLDATANDLLVRVSGDAEQAKTTLERRLDAIDSSAVIDAHTLDAALSLQVYPFRAMYWVASALGVIALLLTLIGVYGVMSYLVAQRRKEFGIRLALGAAAATLVALVLRQSIRLAIIGAALGVIIALGVSRLFANVVFSLNTYDAFGYASALTVVLLACLFAAYVPSRRAASVDPVEALRADS